MTLQIPLDKELKKKISDAAKKRGVKPATYARMLLVELQQQGLFDNPFFKITVNASK